MKANLLLVFLSSIFYSKFILAEEWIGLEAEPTLIIGFLYTEDEAKNTTSSIYLSKLMPNAVTVNLELSNDHLQNRQQTFESETFYGQLDWLLENDINLAVSYQFQGKKSELEVSQYAGQLGYSPYPAFMSIEYLQGDVIIFTREDIPVDINIPETVCSDFTAYTYHFGWWFDSFSLSVRHQSFDYELDISALGSRPLFQLLVKPAALVHSGLLLSDRSTFTIDIPLKQKRLAGHIMQTRSAISKQQTRSLQLDWSQNLSDSTLIMLSINRSDEDQDNWFFSVGLEWSA